MVEIQIMLLNWDSNNESWKTYLADSVTSKKEFKNNLIGIVRNQVELLCLFQNSTYNKLGVVIH
jgi:hypothetical protein